MRPLRALAIASGAIAGACSPVAVQPVTAGDTSIAFAANGGIRDWHANGEQGIYLRDRSGRWYLATFNGVCPNLPAAQTIAFGTDAAGTLDRFSSITTEYARCQIGTIVRSQAPAGKGGPAGN
ncbi:MAG TPA: DUF6491 family protein [Sphingomicrobium sp.]|nr:DUF6491 family protein [Sphingomicrobium sp.]